jgi:hypothetical protein
MEIYDLLEKRELVNDSIIEKKIRHDWSIKDILDFNEQINPLIKPIDEIMGDELPNYKFVANAELSGQDYGGCRGLACRIERVDELTRFATLWAEKIYIPSYFDEHRIMSEASAASESRNNEFEFKNDYSGHIKCLLRLKPLLENGIVEIIRGEAQVCPTCMAEKINQCEEIKNSLLKHVEVLADEYRKMVSAKLIKDERREKLGIYCVEMKVPEEISHHKSMIRTLYKLPAWLKTKYMNTETTVTLGKRELRKLGIPDSYIQSQAYSVMFSQVLSTLQGLDASLLTNSHLEVQLLNYIANSDENINRNQVLQRELACELPILLGIPLESLIEIREKEHEAFLVYRDSIRIATNEYISKGLNSKDAKQVYEDLILPKLNSLNLEVKVIKDRAWRNLKLDISVLVTCGVFGLLSNLLAMQIPLLAASGVTGVTLVDIAKNFGDASGTPSEIKKDDFYFLWKASRKAVTERKIK